MHEFILAICLILISVLPQNGVTKRIEKNLENKVLPKTESKNQISLTSKVALVPTPDKNINPENISVGARAAFFIDLESGKEIYSKNEKQKVPMASITKLMTALVGYEFLEPERIITIPSYNLRPLDSVMGIPVGTKIKMNELMHGLLIESGADAAQAIAKTVSRTEPEFVALMNERAKLIGLQNTQFTNSVGYDDVQHYSTAEDLVKLSRIALSNENIAQIVAKKGYVAISEDGKKFPLQNTNKLINGSTYKGLKTGTTFVAGECLAIFYNDGERKIIGVILNSPNRFGETSAVIGWAKRNFSWPALKQ